MSKINIKYFDYRFNTTQNLKSNFLSNRLSQNRWGKKFAKLYKRHWSDYSNNSDIVGRYNFTEGMYYSVENRYATWQDRLDKATNLRNLIRENVKVKDNDVWSMEPILKSSYIVALIDSYPTNNYSGIYKIKLDGLKFSLSIYNGESRAISWFYITGSSFDINCILEPLKDNAYALYLKDENGNNYGHIEGLKPGTNYLNILNLYGIEKRDDDRFDNLQDSKFESFWQDLQEHIKIMLNRRINPKRSEKKAIVIGFAQFLNWLDGYISNLQKGVAISSGANSRAQDDFELIKHLGLADSLNSQIENPADIDKIYFKLEKYVSSGSNWWENSEFDEIRDHFKDFYKYCEFIPNANNFNNSDSSGHIRVKKEAFELSGYKIYWIVKTFLDVDVEEDSDFFDFLFSLFMLGVSIFLTVMTDNPAWLKALLVTTEVLNFAGVLDPELGLIITAITFVYGNINTDFSSMSGMEVFKWAVDNVNIVGKMLAQFNAINKNRDSDFKDLATKQNETIDFLYTKAYSQYDSFYNSLYDYDNLIFGIKNY